MNYNIADIKTNFSGLVGFNPSPDPSFPVLSTELLTSYSGIIFNDGYVPYITLQNIKDLTNNYSLYDYSEYNIATNYVIGNRIKYPFPEYVDSQTYVTGEEVVYNSIGYKSLSDANTGNQPDENLNNWEIQSELFCIYDALTNSINKQPDLNISDWQEQNLFNLFIEDRIKTSIVNVLQNCIVDNNIILEQKELYNAIGDGSQLITNSDKWTGLKIDFARKQNLIMKINKIALQFSGAETDLDIYVYNQNTQQFTFKVTNANNDFLWIDVSDLNITTEKPGSWFIFYKQEDLSSQAVNNQRQFSRNISNFIKFNMFEVAADTDLKTVSSENYLYNESRIANIDYSIFPDLTKWLILNKSMFANIIKLQFCLEMYKTFLNNPNSRINNPESAIDFDMIKMNIIENKEDRYSLYSEIQKKTKELRLSIGKAEIDNTTLPKNKNYITMGYR